MSFASKSLLASALAVSVAAPAFAQEQNTLLERNVYLFMNGKMVHTSVNDATHATIMQHFKPLKDGTMVYLSGGKLYMSEDAKMPDGKLMSTAIFGRDLGIGSER